MSIDPVGIRISGPLAGFAEGYATELTQLGYAPASVRLQMCLASFAQALHVRAGAEDDVLAA